MKRNKFEGINCGSDQIDLSDLDIKAELRPLRIYYRENGTLDNSPSFAIVMSDRGGLSVVGQLSLRMFNEGLADIGYKIVKT